MGPKLRTANLLFLLILMVSASTRTMAYEISPSGTTTPTTSGGINALFKNGQPEINDILKGLSVTGSKCDASVDTKCTTSINSLFNFKNFSTNDISGMFKAVFGLIFKVLAVIVTVTIDALRGILSSISTSTPK